LTITLDTPLYPSWIQHVLAYWRPGRAFDELADTLPCPPTGDARRQAVATILQCFVPLTDYGEPQRPAAGNLWPVYSRAYPPTTLAAPYLAHLIARDPLAGTVTRAIAGPYAPGHRFNGEAISRRVAVQHNQCAGSGAAAMAFLHTLQNFGVVEAGDAPGTYRYATQLIVDQPVFPLLVWSWWQAHHTPEVDLERFAGHTAFLFLHTGDFDLHWRSFDGRRWSLDGSPPRHATLAWGTSHQSGSPGSAPAEGPGSPPSHSSVDSIAVSTTA
jgi:hypothetical protein